MLVSTFEVVYEFEMRPMTVHNFIYNFCFGKFITFTFTYPLQYIIIFQFYIHKTKM
jgi:hypothetical protein